MGLPKAVKIREVGPREGFQTSSKVAPTGDKLALIEALSHTGLKDIEITSFVRPDRVPQMADAEEVVAKFKRQPGINYTALYLNPTGFERAEASGRLDNEAWLYAAASETFLAKNNNTTLDKVVAEIPDWLAMFKKAGKPLNGLMLSTAFGCNYEGPVSEAKVISILERISEAVTLGGQTLKEICLADTMGWASPEMLRRLVSKVQGKYSTAVVTLHLHDTRGTGMANVYAGLLEGVSIFDTSIGGLGGCPFAKGGAGNVCTEDVAFMCRELGIETGLKLDGLVEATKLAEKIMGYELPGKLYKTWQK